MVTSADRVLPRTLNTVFLDRDGVLNCKLPEGRYVTTWSEFQPLPGVLQAIARLNSRGLRVIVVSNQRGIALGAYTSVDVHKIHAELQSWLQSEGAHIDAFYFCPHDKQKCNCRKPLPGLFHQASTQFPAIAVESSIMIGDSLSDIQFGHRLGMRTIFLEGDPQLQKPGVVSARRLADLCFPSLPEATDALLAQLPLPVQL
ncbi:MAG TPA: HAD family hydrolase [Acidobacteriaceae bacterium]|nr:HAD family hydrolase [Acidobacteriaceae bacterium]